MTPTPAQIEAAIIRLCDALLRQGTEQDGAWGWPAFRDEVRAVRDSLTAAAAEGADLMTTQPTQAQLQAAMEARPPWGDDDYWRKIFTDALTAAAEVGERGAITGDPDVDNMTPGAAFNAGRRMGIAATIERCAQVATELAANAKSAIRRGAFIDAVAAIRAMKDK